MGVRGERGKGGGEGRGGGREWALRRVGWRRGELVATGSSGAWTMYDTDAEAARKIGMAMLYNRAWGEAERAARRTEGACPQPAAAESGTGACLDVTA